nr:urea transporter [Odoribacter sp.]
KVNWRTFLWSLVGIVATVFIQAAMDTFFTPFGIPTLTGPFCVATWLFLLPHLNLDKKVLQQG